MGITPKQWAAMNARLSNPRRAAPTAESAPSAARSEVILGIDPSLRGTGFGVIRTVRSQPAALAYGTIKIAANWERSRCLAKIAQALREVIRAHPPTVCVMEGLFYAQNLKTALILGEARGAALAVVGEAGLDVFEIAPRKMKLAMVGYGAARKEAVSRMVQRMLNLDAAPEPDAADALALALVHAQSNGRGLGSRPKRL